MKFKLILCPFSLMQFLETFYFSRISTWSIKFIIRNFPKIYNSPSPSLVVSVLSTSSLWNNLALSPRKPQPPFQLYIYIYIVERTVIPSCRTTQPLVSAGIIHFAKIQRFSTKLILSTFFFFLLFWFYFFKFFNKLIIILRYHSSLKLDLL